MFGKAFGKVFGGRSDNSASMRGQKSEGKCLVFPTVNMLLSLCHKLPKTRSRLMLNNVHNLVSSFKLIFMPFEYLSKMSAFAVKSLLIFSK